MDLEQLIKNWRGQTKAQQEGLSAKVALSHVDRLNNVFMFKVLFTNEQGTAVWPHSFRCDQWRTVKKEINSIFGDSLKVSTDNVYLISDIDRIPADNIVYLDLARRAK